MPPDNLWKIRFPVDFKLVVEVSIFGHSNLIFAFAVASEQDEVNNKTIKKMENIFLLFLTIIYPPFKQNLLQQLITQLPCFSDQVRIDGGFEFFGDAQSQMVNDQLQIWRKKRIIFNEIQ